MKTVAVFFGGKSAEHDVSIVTALASIIKPLELSKKYIIEPVYIAKDGSWYWDQKLKDISLYQSGEIDDFVNKSPKIHILFDNGLTLVKSSQFAGRKTYKHINIAFTAMHGTHGEDGELMGIFEMANVPYVGCGVAASAVAMDKVLCKQVTTSEGIATTPWVWFYSHELSEKHSEVIKRINTLTYPLFVKPARLGSSIGITKVEKPENLNNALEVAVHYDNKVIVEEAVPNLIEVTLPIMGNEDPIPAYLEQPLLNAEYFFDFETKYMGNGGKKGGKKMTAGAKQGAQGYSKIPADLPKEVYEKAQQMGLDVYKAIGAEGMARVDMLIDGKTKKVMFNEVNPLPGSLYAHNWRAKGYSAVDLVDKMIDFGLARHTRDASKQTSFSTNFLKQF